MIAAGSLSRRIRIERPVSNGGIDGAGSGEWISVCTVSANVVDALPSRGERLADGINVAAQPARVRIRYRSGLDASMRFLLLRREGEQDIVERTMQIVAGPAEIGRREGLEFMVESVTSAGNAA